MTTPPQLIDGEDGPPLLRLQFSLTPKERSDAESVALRHAVGGGSKWLTMLVLLAVLGLALWAVWVRVVAEVPRQFRPYLIAGIAALWLFFFIRQRRQSRRGGTGLATVDICEGGVRVTDGSSGAGMPWSAFSEVTEGESLVLLRSRTAGVNVLIPARVLPSPEWLDWLRARVAGGSEASPASHVATTAPGPAASRDAVTLEFRQGFRDLLDLNRASWFTRSVALAWVIMNFGATAYVGMHPPPHAKFTIGETFLYFSVPVAVIGAAFLTLFITAHSWLTHRTALGHRRVRLSDNSFTVVDANGEFTGPLDQFTTFKETPRTFVVWRGWAGNWLLLPKRAFHDLAAIERCRQILGRRLKASRWFFGH